MGSSLSGFDKIGVFNWYIYGIKSFGQVAFDKYNFPPPLEKADDLTNDVFIVTGANSGLGFSTASEIARCGGIVGMVCRNETRGQEALSLIKATAKNPNNVKLFIGDMSKPSSVKLLAEKILTEYNNRVNVLVNNAGVLNEKRVTVTEGTRELDASWATMIGGTYLLTALFKDVLLKESKEGRRARVIDVSSGGMYTSVVHKNDPFGWETGNDRQKEENYRGDVEYSMNKRVQVYLNSAWQRWFSKSSATPSDSVFCASMHPGWAHTLGVEKMYPGFFESNKSRFRTQEAGADTIVWLGGAPIKDIMENAESVKHNYQGSFWLDRHPANKELTLTSNKLTPSLEEQIWNLCGEWTDVSLPFPANMS